LHKKTFLFVAFLRIDEDLNEEDQSYTLAYRRENSPMGAQ